MSEKHKSGTKFNKLEVIKYIRTDKCRRRWYLCKCDCGSQKEVRANHLNSGQIKSCGCSKLVANSKRKKPDYFNSKNAIMINYKRQAKAREIDFLLSREDFFDFLCLNCHYCNSLPSNTYYGFLYSGIDRVDSKNGYTKDNCVPCCKVCNLAKSNMGVVDFLKWISRVYKFSIESSMNKDGVTN